MTRKDFELIATTLRHERPDRDGSRWADGARDAWSTIVLQFADALATTNRSFDRARFLAACGMDA
jgi:hypothetical protein